MELEEPEKINSVTTGVQGEIPVISEANRLIEMSPSRVASNRDEEDFFSENGTVEYELSMHENDKKSKDILPRLAA